MQRQRNLTTTGQNYITEEREQVTGLAPSYQSCDIPGELQPEG